MLYSLEKEKDLRRFLDNLLKSLKINYIVFFDFESDSFVVIIDYTRFKESGSKLDDTEIIDTIHDFGEKYLQDGLIVWATDAERVKKYEQEEITNKSDSILDDHEFHHLRHLLHRHIKNPNLLKIDYVSVSVNMDVCTLEFAEIYKYLKIKKEPGKRFIFQIFEEIAKADRREV